MTEEPEGLRDPEATINVIVKPDGDDVWVAQGIEVDYATEGPTVDEVKGRFVNGLEKAVMLNIERTGGLASLPALDVTLDVTPELRGDHIYAREDDESLVGKIHWHVAIATRGWWQFFGGVLLKSFEIKAIEEDGNWKEIHDQYDGHLKLYRDDQHRYLVSFETCDDYQENIFCEDLPTLIQCTEYLRRFRDFWTRDER